MNLFILVEIPFDRQIAEAHSRGDMNYTLAKYCIRVRLPPPPPVYSNNLGMLE
jgi:hypothetical protein